jgi:hypothetical protein
MNPDQHPTPSLFPPDPSGHFPSAIPTKILYNFFSVILISYKKIYETFTYNMVNSRTGLTEHSEMGNPLQNDKNQQNPHTRTTDWRHKRQTVDSK